MEDNFPAVEQQFPLRSSNQQSKGDDFLSPAKVAVRPPPPGSMSNNNCRINLAGFCIPSSIQEREAEGKCIDVYGECSATKEKKAREQAMINTVLKILLSQ